MDVVIRIPRPAGMTRIYFDKPGVPCLLEDDPAVNTLFHSYWNLVSGRDSSVGIPTEKSGFDSQQG
jgi:hypothetical protein